MNTHFHPHFGAVYTSAPPKEVPSTTFFLQEGLRDEPTEYWVTNGTHDTDLDDVLALREKAAKFYDDPDAYKGNDGYNEESRSTPLQRLEELYHRLAKESRGPYSES